MFAVGTQIGAIQYVMLKILCFIHPHLHRLVANSLSAGWKNQTCTCEKRKKCSCGASDIFLLPEPKQWPYSLYVRSNYYKSGYNLIREGVFLESVKNAWWCIDPFRWYVKTYRNKPKKFEEWPTCIKAYEEATLRSPLLLMWARKNRCSCLHDMKTIRPLSCDEKEVLNWLEANSERRFLSKPYFRDHYDPPIERNAETGTCLWTKYMVSPLQPSPSIVVTYDEEEVVETQDLSEALNFEIRNLSPAKVASATESLKAPLQTSFIGPLETSVSVSQGIWDYEREFNTIVTTKGLVTAVNHVLCPELTAAFTIFAHAARMEILQNEDSESCVYWKLFIEADFCKKPKRQVSKEEYSTDRTNARANFVSFMMDKCSKIIRANFLQQFEISLNTKDTTDQIGTNLISALTVKEGTGLYLCRYATTYSVHAGRPRDLTAEYGHVPLLIRKDNKCFQNVASIYQRPSDGQIKFRIITRSLLGLHGNHYIWCEYTWLQTQAKWDILSPAPVNTVAGQVFPIYLGDIRSNDKHWALTASVYIPTKTQNIPSGSFYSMELSNEMECFSAHKWVLKDTMSLDEHDSKTLQPPHLTERVLNRLVSDLMTEYNYEQSKQHVIVLPIDELSSMKEYLSSPIMTITATRSDIDYLVYLPKETFYPCLSCFSPKSSTSSSSTSSSSSSSSSSSINSSSSSSSSATSSSSSSSNSSSSVSSASSDSFHFSPQLIKFKHLLRESSRSRNGILHIIVSYKDSEGLNCWVYAYFHADDNKLLILTRRCDPVREILNISASLKCFIGLVFPARQSSLKITQVLWIHRNLCGFNNSGYYALKQFWQHAEIIRKSKNCWHYMSLIRESKKRSAPKPNYNPCSLSDDDEEEERLPKLPAWKLTAITMNQLSELKIKITAELFSIKPAANSSYRNRFYIPDFLLR